MEVIQLICPALPTIAPSEIMRRIKGRSASKLLEDFPKLRKRFWGRHFWARSYFCVSSGQITDKMIKTYLEHHFEPKKDDDLRTES